MNKTEAALFLGVSVRTLDNYTKQGRISPSFIPSANSRPTADFAEGDLQKLKDEVAVTTPVTATVRAKSDVAETALAKVESPVAPPDLSALALILEQLRPPEVRLAEMPFLTFAQAARLFNIPEQRLRDAVKADELKAVKQGRGQQVRAKDVHAWRDSKFDQSV